MRISDWSSDVCSSDLSGPPSLSCNLSSVGISSRQGPHQVAQMLSSTILPRKSVSVTDLPLPSLKRSSATVRGASCKDMTADSRPASVDGAAAVSGSASPLATRPNRSEEHTSELPSLMRISYAVFCLKHKNTTLTQ